MSRLPPPKRHRKTIRKLEVVNEGHYRAEFIDNATGETFVSDIHLVEDGEIRGLEFRPDGFLMRGEIPSRSLTALVMAFHDLHSANDE